MNILNSSCTRLFYAYIALMIIFNHAKMKVLMLCLALLCSCVSSENNIAERLSTEQNNPSVVDQNDQMNEWQNNTYIPRIYAKAKPVIINFLDGTSCEISNYDAPMDVLSQIKPRSIVRKKMKVYKVLTYCKAGYYFRSSLKQYDKYNMNLLRGREESSVTAYELLYDQESYLSISVLGSGNTNIPRDIYEPIKGLHYDSCSVYLPDNFPLPSIGIANVWVVSHEKEDNNKEIVNFIILDKVDFAEEKIN